MKIQLIDFGGRGPERAHANDAGADVFSPKDAVIRPGDDKLPHPPKRRLLPYHQ